MTPFPPRRRLPSAAKLPAAPFRSLSLGLALAFLWGCGGSEEAPGADSGAAAGVDAPGAPAAGSDADPSGPPTAPPQARSVLLHLVEVDEAEGIRAPRILLEDCRDEATAPGPDARPVEDATGADLAEMIRSFGSPAGGVRARVVTEGDRVTELRIAPPEVPGCDRLLAGGDVVASGNEPFWNVTVDGEAATWRTPEELDGVEFHEGSWERTAEGWRFEALRDFVDGMEYLVLVVTPVPCMDTMSGARYPWTAMAERGGSQWEGCAREGR